MCCLSTTLHSTGLSSSFAENATVVIHGIGARPELNGQTATVQRHDAGSGRVVVRLDGGEQVGDEVELDSGRGGMR